MTGSMWCLFCGDTRESEDKVKFGQAGTVEIVHTCLTCGFADTEIKTLEVQEDDPESS